MVRVISQETFDAVVKENMEEFEMSREEAIKEAVEQFQSQVFKYQIGVAHLRKLTVSLRRALTTKALLLVPTILVIRYP